MEVKYFMAPEEVREFENGKIELVSIGGKLIGKATFMPGWKWSSHVKPIAKTDWCEAPHFQYLISGILHVVMTESGEGVDLKPGSVASIPPGHDAWVVGNEPVVALDFQGMADYAKKKA